MNVQTLVELPEPLKVAIAGAVLFVVRLLLNGRVPDKWASELAAVLTTAILAVIQLLLGLVPPEFEALAASILALLVVLLGMVAGFRAYNLIRNQAEARGLKM